MEETIRKAMAEVEVEENGSEALDILHISAYLATAKDIHEGMFSCLFLNSENVSSATRLLQKSHLIESHDRESMFRMKKSTQSIIIDSLRRRESEKEVLQNAISAIRFLLNENTISSNSLDHSMSVLSYVSDYEDLINLSIELPNLVVIHLKKQLRLNEAEAFGQKALKVLKKVVGEGHEVTLALETNLIASSLMNGKHTENIDSLKLLYEKDLKYSRKEDRMHTAALLVAEQSELCRFDEALPLFQTLIAGKKVSETTDRSLLTTFQDYAIVLSKMGRHSEANDILEDVFKQRQKVWDSDNSEILQTRLCWSLVLREQKKYSQALYQLNDALQEGLKYSGNFDPVVLRIRREIGIIRLLTGETVKALQIFKDVESKLKQIFNEFHEDILCIQTNIATALGILKNYDKAFSIYKDIHQKYKNHIGASHCETLNMKLNIKRILVKKKKISEALEIIKEALEESLDIFGPNHHSTKQIKTEIYILKLLQTAPIEILHSISEEGDSGDFLSFTETSTNVNEKPHGERTPFDLAALYGHVRDAECLLGRGALHSVEERTGETPVLLTSNEEVRDYLPSDENLFEDVKNGKSEKVAQHLLVCGKLLDARDKEGFSLLHWAVNGRHVSVVKQLIKAGIDVNCVSRKKGNTSLHIASSKGYTEIAEILLQSAPELINARTTVEGNAALHVAAANGHLDLVLCLLKYGASFDICNKKGETPASLSNVQPVRDLLNTTRELFRKAEKGNLEIVASLRKLKPAEFKAVALARNGQNRTLLQVAAANKHRNITEKMIEMLRE
ncbi:ankyrin-2 [Nephila pilipes]|uniref:Ankyrin-2 n=1 Tax=Nephila pilipes TaxID=299642 RepID=A0A8X6INC9_NEPPI|nr:ankyrin-2 [Nephila pilipes]